MRIERATKYGLVAAAGVLPLTGGTRWLIRQVRAGAGDAQGTVIFVGVAGTVVTLIFLFAVVGAYVDRELEARGIEPEE